MLQFCRRSPGVKPPAVPSWLRLLPELYETRTLAELPDHLVDIISRMMPAEAVAYNEVNLERARMLVAMNPAELSDSPLVRRLEPLIQEHPLVRHQQKTGDFTARKISDFLSRKQYHRTAIYQEVYRHLGCEDQFALTLRVTPGTIVAMAMNRARRNFTEADRESLNAMQPHFIQAYKNAEARTGLQEQLNSLGRLFEHIPLGMVLLDRRQRIQFAAQRARTLLQSYFGTQVNGQILPDALRQWLAKSHHCDGQALPSANGTFCQDGLGARLTVRCVRTAGFEEAYLLLEERRSHFSAKPLEALGLTAREAEVLLWVAQGKSSPEIAIILGAARRTIQKHTERIFSKLGVESRTAAARRALEILNEMA